MSMTLNKFQQGAYEFAIYPDDHVITYPALLTCAEAGEMANKVQKWLRKDQPEMTKEQELAIVDECGDVLWAVAALLTDLGYKMDFCAERNLAKLSGRKERGTIEGEGDVR